MVDEIENDPGFESVVNDFIERQRIRDLSNEELVREYLKIGDGDDELHVNAMMDRLWPDWHNSEEEDDERIKSLPGSPG